MAEPKPENEPKPESKSMEYAKLTSLLMSAKGGWPVVVVILAIFGILRVPLFAEPTTKSQHVDGLTRDEIVKLIDARPIPEPVIDVSAIADAAGKSAAIQAENAVLRIDANLQRQMGEMVATVASVKEANKEFADDFKNLADNLDVRLNAFDKKLGDALDRISILMGSDRAQTDRINSIENMLKDHEARLRTSEEKP